MDLQYLDAVIQKAADLGMFVVIDLHGAPGAQKVKDAFTGQVSMSSDEDQLSDNGFAVPWTGMATGILHTAQL